MVLTGFVLWYTYSRETGFSLEKSLTDWRTAIYRDTVMPVEQNVRQRRMRSDTQTERRRPDEDRAFCFLFASISELSYESAHQQQPAFTEQDKVKDELKRTTRYEKFPQFLCFVSFLNESLGSGQYMEMSPWTQDCFPVMWGEKLLAN